MSYHISVMIIGAIAPRKISKRERNEAIDFLEQHADAAQFGDGVVEDTDPALAIEMLATLWHSEHHTRVGVESQTDTVPNADVMADFLECAALLREGISPWDRLKPIKVKAPKVKRPRKVKATEPAAPDASEGVVAAVSPEPWIVTDDPHVEPAKETVEVPPKAAMSSIDIIAENARKRIEAQRAAESPALEIDRMHDDGAPVPSPVDDPTGGYEPPGYGG